MPYDPKAIETRWYLTADPSTLYYRRVWTPQGPETVTDPRVGDLKDQAKQDDGTWTDYRYLREGITWDEAERICREHGYVTEEQAYDETEVEG